MSLNQDIMQREKVTDPVVGIPRSEGSSIRYYKLYIETNISKRKDIST